MRSREQLPKDATATGITDMLDDPEEYIRGMMANLHEALKIEKESQATIGVTGTGKVPHYKIDVPEHGEFLEMSHSILVFNGRTHERIYDPSQVHPRSWSGRSNTLDELKEKLGELRSKGKRPLKPKAQ
jgi:hypothetical protein